MFIYIFIYFYFYLSFCFSFHSVAKHQSPFLTFILTAAHMYNLLSRVIFILLSYQFLTIKQSNKVPTHEVMTFTDSTINNISGCSENVAFYY